MPVAPLRVCSVPGCSQRTPKGKCAEHQRTTRLHERRHYTGIPGVNYGRKWRKARERFIAEHPLCVRCQARGIVTPSDVVNHIVPHNGDPVLFWDESNWESLCFSDHNAETAKQVGFRQPTQARGACK